MEDFLRKVRASSKRISAEIIKSGLPGVFAAIANAMITGKIALPISLAFGFDFLINKTLLAWDTFPLLFDSLWNRLLCSMTVVIVGLAFYVLRERRLFVYASVEIAAAAATAYNASAKLYVNHDNNAALITLLGSVYISVRAFDNFNKAYHKKRVK